MENELVNHYTDRDHCLNVLIASCLVPGWAGFRPVEINGQYYVDGGLTNNLPIPYDDTIRIQPFSTKPENAEISPLLSYPSDAKHRMIQKCPNQTDFTMHLKRRNLERAFVKALFPPSDQTWYEELFNEGIHDARLYMDNRSRS